MKSDNKFKISGLKKKVSFSDASEIVLQSKLKIVFEEIDAYLKNDSVVNLHKLRIALRRFRYNLEIFYNCIKPKLFKSIYESVEDLQDIIGELRDLDVLKEKLKIVETDLGISVPPQLFEKILNEQLELRLAEFLFNDNLKKCFFKR